ncbi:MAG: hypothetical protein IJK64_02600 [Clostridia bacterium]|nr:hypothetical protein [Clostridia bacterium]
MELLRPAAAAILTLLLYALLRQLRPEFAPTVLLAGICLILLSAAAQMTGLIAETRAMLQTAGVAPASVSILLRALGVCIVTQLAADLCRDHAASALATALELVGRFSALLLALPFLRDVLAIATEMMHG